MKNERLSLAFLGKLILLAFLALVIGNLLSYWVLYADAFPPFSLPYREDFEQPLRLRYRQFGGFWRVQDGALFQNDRSGTDLIAVIPLTISAAQPYHFESRITIASGPNGGGLMFNLQHPNTPKQSHLVRFGTDNGNNYLVFGYFDEAMNFISQGSLTSPDLSQGVRLAVNVHEDNYDVLVDGQPLQTGIPLQYKGGNVALTTWFSAVNFDEITLYAIDPQLPTPPTTEATDNTKREKPSETTPNQAAGQTVAEPEPTAPIVENANSVKAADTSGTEPSAVPLPVTPVITTTTLDAGELGVWTTFSGQWMVEQGKLVQTQPDGFDHGATTGDKLQGFVMSVRLLHRQGTGGGILFQLATPSAQKSGHMVRFFEDNIIAWGYFEANGNFVGQGNAKVQPIGNQPQLLKVNVKNGTYSITLNDKLLVEGVPLMSKDGYVGLTASKSVVEFDQVQIVTSE